ncbi:MAG: DUF4349 domain-containing protein [Bacteroidales bacterium]|jgi:hypothetical protein
MKKIFYILFATAITMAGCGGSNKREMEKYKAKADSIAPSSYTAKKTDSISKADYVSSSAAVVNKKDTTRKFVRTAELKFRVKNVYKASLEIERFTAANNGFVTYTNLNSTIDRKEITPVSIDSSLESIYYDVVNDINIRVPNYNLDSIIRQIAPLIDYLDYRTIKADDVSMLLTSNNMMQQRITGNTQQLSKAADQKSKNATETVNIQENIYHKQTELDRLKAYKNQLMDEVNFSTLVIFIYQRQVIKHSLIENDKNIKAYKPGFWRRTKEGIVFSFDMLLEIILFFIRLWAIWLILFVAYILFRKFALKKPKE